MTRHLLTWISRTLTDCPPLMANVDGSRGLRRVDKAEVDHFQKCLTFGRLTRGPVPGRSTRAMWVCTVTFAPYVRPDTDADGNLLSGDLVLEDVEDWVLRALVVRESGGIAGQTCYEARRTLVVLDAQFDGDTIEPNFDEDLEAWTKQFRIRFVVSIASCHPVLEWCGPCAAA